MDKLVTRLLPALRRLHAENDVDDALRLIETIPDLLAGTAGIGTATVLLDVGGGFEGGSLEAPLGCLGAARALFESEEFAHGVGACDVSAAAVAVASDDLERAVQLYERGLELLDTDVGPAMAGRGWHNFGILLRTLGRPADCLDAQQRALAAYRHSGLALPTADCHVGVGMALHDLGEPADALEPYAAARALYIEFGAQHLLADVDDRRGLALCDLGRYEEADLAHAGAIERFERLDEIYCAARSRRYRSHPLDHAGRREEAVGDLEVARTTFADLGDDLEVARCAASLAAALIGLGQPEAARALLDGARRVFDDHDEQQAARWCAELLADPTAVAHRHP